MNTKKLLLIALVSATTSTAFAADSDDAEATHSAATLTSAAARPAAARPAAGLSVAGPSVGARPQQQVVRQGVSAGGAGGADVVQRGQGGSSGTPASGRSACARAWYVKARHGGKSGWSQALVHSAWSAALVTSIVSQLVRANARLKVAAKLKKAEHVAGTRFLAQEDAQALDDVIQKSFNAKALGEMLTGHLKGTVLRGNIYDIVNAWLTNLLLTERVVAVGEHLTGAKHLK